MDPHLLALLDLNLADSLREFARWQVGAELVERDGLLAVAGSTPFQIGYTNCALRTDPALSPRAFVEAARAFFAPRGRGYTIFVRRHCDGDLVAALEGAKVVSILDQPCMVVHEPLAEPPLPPGVELRWVEDEQRAAGVVTVNADAYESLGFPPAEARALYGRLACLLGPQHAVVLASRDGAPLATAMTMLSAGVGGVYWVGTAKHARRQGLAAACTGRVTNTAFGRGARAVTLQASPMGEPIYAQMGYRTFDRLRWYVMPAA